MANPRTVIRTSVNNDGYASTAGSFFEAVGHPVGVVVSPQTDSSLPLCTITLGQNPFLTGMLLGVGAGGTGADLSASSGIPYLPGAGAPAAAVPVGTSGYALGSDGTTTPVWMDVITPAELSATFSAITAGYVMYGTGTSSIGNEANLFYDAANNRLGVGDVSVVDEAGPDAPAKTLSVWGDVGLYDPAAYTFGAEVITDGGLASGTTYWDNYFGCAFSGGAAVFTYPGFSATSELNQLAANFQIPAPPGTYTLTYTISGSAPGVPSSNAFNISLWAPAGTGDTVVLDQSDGTHTAELTITGTSDDGLSFWGTLNPSQSFTIDDISLKRHNTPAATITLDNSGEITASTVTLDSAGTYAAPQVTFKAAGVEYARMFVTNESSLFWGSETPAGATTGAEGNVGIGTAALSGLTTGSFNTCIGSDTGSSITTGDNNICLGYLTEPTAPDASNELNLGNTLYGDLTAASLRIGAATPTARLHLPAGTATASTAPMKFGTGGVVLAAPEAQAVESTDTHFYWTNTAGTRYPLDSPILINVTAEIADTSNYVLYTDGAGDQTPKNSYTLAGGGLMFDAASGGLAVSAPGSTITPPADTGLYVYRTTGSAGALYGGRIFAVGTSADGTNGAVGIESSASIAGTGAATGIIGGFAHAILAGSRTQSASYGTYGFFTQPQTQNTATADKLVGYYAQSIVGATSTVTSTYGAYLDNPTGAPVNNYGLYIAAQTAGSGSNYSIYSAGGAAYFAGTVTAGAFTGPITVANEATDTTCFPLFVTAATGDLGPKTNAGFLFNANTGALGIGAAPSTRLHVTGANCEVRSTGTTTNASATFSVYCGTSGGFFRAYGQTFAVSSLANKASFGPDGATGIVVFANAAVTSGGSGSISLRGGGYDTGAESIFCDKDIVIVNDPGANVDFRVEGDTATNLLVCDAGLDAVQIGTTTAAAIADFRATYIELKQDTYWTGAGIGLPYGSCYGNDIAWSQAGAVQDTWYIVSDTDMADGSGGLNLVTHDGSGKLTVTNAGRYEVHYSATIGVSIANKLVQTSFAINGTPTNDGLQHIVGTAVANMSVSGCAILALTAGQYVEFAIRTTDAGTPDLSVEHLNLTIHMVGG